MPFVPAPGSKCPACEKSVYDNEAKLAAGVKWHPMCFKCYSCNKMLDSTTVAGHEGKVFCKQCHNKQFGPKGYGFGGGASGLGTDTGGGSSDMKDRVAASTVSGPVVEGGCPRCGKRVYEAEKKVGAGRSTNTRNCHSPNGRQGLEDDRLSTSPSIFNLQVRIGPNDRRLPLKVVIRASKKDWHRGCFNCKNCHKSLDSSTLNEKEAEIFCKNCYAKSFGPHGKI